MKLGNTALTETGIVVDGTPHRISRQRRRILERLMRAKGSVVDHETLMDVVWDGRDDGPECPKIVHPKYGEWWCPAVRKKFNSSLKRGQKIST